MAAVGETGTDPPCLALPSAPAPCRRSAQTGSLGKGPWEGGRPGSGASPPARRCSVVAQASWPGVPAQGRASVRPPSARTPLQTASAWALRCSQWEARLVLCVLIAGGAAGPASGCGTPGLGLSGRAVAGCAAGRGPGCLASVTSVPPSPAHSGLRGEAGRPRLGNVPRERQQPPLGGGRVRDPLRAPQPLLPAACAGRLLQQGPRVPGRAPGLPWGRAVLAAPGSPCPLPV